MWDQSTSSPRFKNFMSGANDTIQGKTAWRAGSIYGGFDRLASYSSNALLVCQYSLRAINNGVNNESLNTMDTYLGRTVLCGNTALGVSTMGKPPYATLSGVINGSGTTGTNWTHIAGPAGWTIEKPTSPVTRVRFTTAAVGGHTFRLTVTSSGPTVSDDVGVTVQAAPAF